MSDFDNNTERQRATGGFQDGVRAVADDAVEAVDTVIDKAAGFVGNGRNSRIIGGAAVGALAAVVLPISLAGGAVLGGLYAAFRQTNR